MPVLTLYCPTYNREKELRRLYESLCQQTCFDFIFTVVDDGSTDCTRDLVNSWVGNSPFEVRYIYKENGGVHTARDAAYHICDTELIGGLDSDDYVLPGFVSSVLTLWSSKPLPSDNYCGIWMPMAHGESAEFDSYFPNIKECTAQEFRYKYSCKGEYVFILRSDIIKSIPDAPTFPNEKLVSEIWKNIQLPELPFILGQERLVVHNYLDDGYTKDIRKTWFKNIHGFRAEYNMCSKMIKYFIPRAESTIKYIVTCLYIKDGTTLKAAYRPAAVFFLFPLGVAAWAVTLVKWKNYRQYLS